WSSTPGTDGTVFSVDAQRYDASGAPLGGNFLVNSYTTGTQWNPSVAHAPAGSFAIAFSGDQPDSPFDVLVRRYTAAGAPVGPEFRVNAATAGLQVYPHIAFDGAANFVVSWADLGQAGDGDGIGLRGRRFRP